MATASGWNTWDVRHLNAVVHLPTAARLWFRLHDPGSGQFKDEFNWRHDMRRLGPHAADGSYAQADLRWGHAAVTFEYASAGDRLVCRITPATETRGLWLVVQLDTAWERAGSGTCQNEQLRLSTGDRTWRAQATTTAAGLPALAGTPHLAFPLDQAVLIEVAPDTAPAAAELARFVDAQRDACLAAGLHSEGWLADAADALTRSIAWNTIWEPIKGRICTPVSRDWCKGSFFGSYVLFDWDTFFCAVMAQLGDPALAAANAQAILQELAPTGFVPNFGCEFGPSEDRSQPPVGSYCVLKLYRASALSTGERDRGLLEHTFPALLRWHEWWMPHRDGNKDGLLEWGSDPIAGYRDPSAGTLQGAMYESGLDNSPMYDETAYNEYFHTMELSDVGLNALYALDAWALSEIARELGQVTRSQQLTAEYALMAQRINEHLWSEEAGIYLNRHWDDRLSPRLSPTLFYPLIAGVASPEQAERMVKEHLLNPDEFWGRYVMPSIARDDPGYAGNDYWRGRIWGPMNFLVGEGLRRYRFDDVAHEFARRGLDLLLGEWQSEGHVHENFNAETGDGDDMPNSDPMYTWGALLGYIAMQELVDCEPWSGWRFGNTSGEPISLAGVRAGGSGPDDRLDAELDPQGLRVTLNGDLLVLTDRPALITGWRHDRSRLACHVSTTGHHEVELTLGHLPALADVMVKIDEHSASRRTDENGQLHLTIAAPCRLEVAC